MRIHKTIIFLFIKCEKFCLLVVFIFYTLQGEEHEAYQKNMKDIKEDLT